MSNQSGPQWTSPSEQPRSGPPVRQDHPASSPPPGGPQGRDGMSTGWAVVLLVGAGLLVLGLVVGLVVLLLGALSTDEPDDPAPVAASEQASASVRTQSPGRATTGTASSAPSRAASSSAERAAAGDQRLGVPKAEPLAEKSGTLQETVLDEQDRYSLEVPAGDEPLLVVWTARESERDGTLYLAGFTERGGELSDSLPVVRPGKTGTALINTGSPSGRTGVLYVNGTAGVSWEVKLYPVSAVPRMERGGPVTGSGAGVFRLPEGPGEEYTLDVAAEHDVPSVAVYDPSDLALAQAREHTTSPAQLTVPVGRQERIVVVESEADWTFAPKG